jgi:hypothetical protein
MGDYRSIAVVQLSCIWVHDSSHGAVSKPDYFRGSQLCIWTSRKPFRHEYAGDKLKPHCANIAGYLGLYVQRPGGCSV